MGGNHATSSGANADNQNGKRHRGRHPRPISKANSFSYRKVRIYRKQRGEAAVKQQRDLMLHLAILFIDARPDEDQARGPYLPRYGRSSSFGFPEHWQWDLVSTN